MARLRRVALRLLLLGAGGLLLSYVMALVAFSLQGVENPWSEALILISTMGYGVASDMGAWAVVTSVIVGGVSIFAVQAGILLGIVALLFGGTHCTGNAGSD